MERQSSICRRRASYPRGIARTSNSLCRSHISLAGGITDSDEWHQSGRHGAMYVCREWRTRAPSRQKCMYPTFFLEIFLLHKSVSLMVAHHGKAWRFFAEMLFSRVVAIRMTREDVAVGDNEGFFPASPGLSTKMGTFGQHLLASYPRQGPYASRFLEQCVGGGGGARAGWQEQLHMIY